MPCAPPRNQVIDWSANAASQATIQVAAANPARGRRENAEPTIQPESPPPIPPASAATGVGTPEASRCAPITAPTATNAPCASEGSPATPTANARPTAAQAR